MYWKNISLYDWLRTGAKGSFAASIPARRRKRPCFCQVMPIAYRENQNPRAAGRSLQPHHFLSSALPKEPSTKGKFI
jgi:hypothetical protein